MLEDKSRTFGIIIMTASIFMIFSSLMFTKGWHPRVGLVHNLGTSYIFKIEKQCRSEPQHMGGRLYNHVRICDYYHFRLKYAFLILFSIFTVGLALFLKLLTLRQLGIKPPTTPNKDD